MNLMISRVTELLSEKGAGRDTAIEGEGLVFSLDIGCMSSVSSVTIGSPRTIRP